MACGARATNRRSPSSSIRLALSQNNVSIPLEAIGALMVLSREHGRENLPELIEPDRRNVTLAVAALVAAALLPYAA
jgi:hypothetical protein